MQMYDEPTHAMVTCDYCDAVNDMTVLNVLENQEVRCSRCGARIGSMADVVGSGRGGTDTDRTRRAAVAMRARHP